MPPSEHSPPRQGRGRSKGQQQAESSPSERPSPGLWNERGRSRVRRQSNPFSEDGLRRRGYHQLHSSFGKVFNVERRWKLIREMGSGAYGVVISAADEISGEAVAIKLVTRVFEKLQLAKRALREITLLRHFAHHENITGLIDVDAISPDFNEIYIFMEPMEADLHQIIKSGQILTNEHCQYFLYQILRGMKYIHSASVIHRDLKPGNLLVNADCELKICDFGLSRGYNSVPDENATHLTEYVATRWYRAPEIMLAFRRYNTAIDVWSIGCILAELLLGRPLFKGKDYVDQLNKILDVLGTPDEGVIRRIGSDKAQAYVRSLPIRKKVPFRKVLPLADPLAVDLLTKMLTFDPAERITVLDALEHPWLASYHDVADEPSCPTRFDRWEQIEQLETIDEFREALWKEIEDYRREVRGGVSIELSGLPPQKDEDRRSSREWPGMRRDRDSHDRGGEAIDEKREEAGAGAANLNIVKEKEQTEASEAGEKPTTDTSGLAPPAIPGAPEHLRPSTPQDPVVTYARRSSIMQPTRQGSTYGSPFPGGASSIPAPTYGSAFESNASEPITAPGGADEDPGPLPPSSVAFPSQGYVLPARSRTASLAGGEPAVRRLLRTLSTVSIHESLDGLPGGLPISKFIGEIREKTTGADAPASEMPHEFAIGEEGTDEDENEHDDGEADEISKSASGSGSGKERTRRSGIFRIH